MPSSRSAPRLCWSVAAPQRATAPARTLRLAPPRRRRASPAPTRRSAACLLQRARSPCRSPPPLPPAPRCSTIAAPHCSSTVPGARYRRSLPHRRPFGRGARTPARPPRAYDKGAPPPER
nr:atherin-like [Aegilops tauschii subsp. strangulata]